MLEDTSCMQTALRNGHEALHCELHASVFERVISKIFSLFLFFLGIIVTILISYAS